MTEGRERAEGMSADELREAISRARVGNADAWGELYRQYAAPIFRLCRRVLPSREDAEDATSEVFLKVREKLGQYDSIRPFGSWLYTVAANHCWDVLRRRRIRQDLETEGVEELPLAHPDPGQLERLIKERSGREVRTALAGLPSRARMALVLRYYADMSYEEIAESLGIRRAFVGVLLLRARHRLREALGRRGDAGLAASGGG